MNPNECSAARALLGLTQSDLAKFAGIGLSSVVDFEAQRRNVSALIAATLQSALENLGVEFVDTENASGVRLRMSLAEVSSIGIAPAQLKAARALLCWNQRELAEAAGLAFETVRRLEKLGGSFCYVSTVEQVHRTLKRACVELIDGQGVLLAK